MIFQGVQTPTPSSGSAHVTNLLLVIYTVLVRKLICRLGQAYSPEPKGYLQIRDEFYGIVMEQIRYTELVMLRYDVHFNDL